MVDSDENSKKVINNSELVEKLGNMYLVKINGELKQVSATYKNKLLYEKKLYELLHPDTENKRVVLTDDSDSDFIAIAPTRNDSIYQLWVDKDGYPVMNTPSMSESILRGVDEALGEKSDYSRLKKLYKEINENQVRRHVIERAASVFPKSEIIPTKDGWSILGMFLLTWDSRIFLDTGDIQEQKSYRVSGSSVSETDNTRSFLQLSVSEESLEKYDGTPLQVHYPISKEVDFEGYEPVNKDCPMCNSTTAYNYSDENAEYSENTIHVCTECTQPWQEFYLEEREIEFIYKAQWLLNCREKYDDKTFWDIIESYVWNEANK